MKRGQPGGARVAPTDPATTGTPTDDAARAGGGHGPGRGPGGPLEGRGAAPGAEIFSFTIEGDQVTAASRTINGNVIPFPTLDTDSFALKGDDIVLTRTFTRGQEVIVFSDADADQLWAIDSRARIHTAAPTVDDNGVVHAHQLQVTLDAATNTVTEVARVLRDGTTKVLQGDDLSFAIDSGLLVQSHTNDAGLSRWEVYRDGNGDGVYTEVAEGFGDLVDLATVISLTDPNIDLL